VNRTSTGDLLERIRSGTDVYLIGIAGIPGSGKSTLAAELCSNCESSVLLPMDGYHIPRSQLDAEGLRRRGAPWTFDHVRLREDLIRLKREHCGTFPDFDHAVKDPEEGAIIITPHHRIVIVEGLYLLLQEWNLSPIFDLTVFVECDTDVAVERLARRHVQCGLEADFESAQRRIAENDILNAETILHDGCANRADVTVSTSPF